jgi:hypothetical protein
MSQKTKIEIEFSETIAYSKRREKFEAYCPNCESLVEMAAPHIAAVLTRSTEREIFSLVETGRIHFVETDGVLICLASLTEFKAGEKKQSL